MLSVVPVSLLQCKSTNTGLAAIQLAARFCHGYQFARLLNSWPNPLAVTLITILSNASLGFLFTECAKCVPGGNKGLTCCGPGGSWRGKCGSSSNEIFDYTWEQGYQVCVEKTSIPPASSATLTASTGTSGTVFTITIAFTLVLTQPILRFRSNLSCCIIAFCRHNKCSKSFFSR